MVLSGSRKRGISFGSTPKGHVVNYRLYGHGKDLDPVESRSVGTDVNRTSEWEGGLG